MLDRGEALGRCGEFGLLQLDEGAHLVAGIAVGQVEHRIVQRVETGQGDELELVAHGAQFLLELGDGGIVEVLLPVEGRRAVVGQHLAGELGMNGFSEGLGVGEVGLAGFAPHQIGIGRVGQTAGDGLLQAGLGAVEAFDRALASAEGLVGIVNVGSDQVGRFGVGARHQHRRHAHDVGRQARCHELGNSLASRHQHLAAHVAAFLHRGQLVFEVHAGGAGLDHGLHQLEGVEHAAETGFGIGHDGGEIVDEAFVTGLLAFHPLNLIGSGEGVVDALDHAGHRVGRIQRLVGIHLASQVGITRHLPARQVDGLQAGLDLLHGLVASQGAQGVDERHVVHLLPKTIRTATGQRMLNHHRTAQAHHFLCAITALDALPARVLRPVLFQRCHLLFAICHLASPGE